MGECKRIVELLGAYIYGDLSPEEMHRVRSHVGVCEACGRELQTRTRAVALVPTELPVLSDEEKLRVMWTVKGAVRAKRASARLLVLRPAFVQGFAVAGLVVGALAAGAIFGMWSRPPRVIVKVIRVKEKAPPAAEPTENIAGAPEGQSRGRPAAPPDPNITAFLFDRSGPLAGYRGGPERRAIPDVLETPPGTAESGDLGLWPWQNRLESPEPGIPLWSMPNPPEAGPGTGQSGSGQTQGQGQ